MSDHRPVNLEVMCPPHFPQVCSVLEIRHLLHANSCIGVVVPFTMVLTEVAGVSAFLSDDDRTHVPATAATATTSRDDNFLFIIKEEVNGFCCHDFVFCKYMPLPCFGRGAESGVIPRFRDCFRRHGRWSLFGSGFMAEGISMNFQLRTDFTRAASQPADIAGSQNIKESSVEIIHKTTAVLK